MSNLLREYVSLILVEKKQRRPAISKEAKTTAAEIIADSIVTAASSIGIGDLNVKVASSAEIRLAPAEPHVFLDEEVSSILKKAKLTIVKLIPKGSPGSISGRFTTYIVKSAGKIYNVVFTSGRNIGQQFEDQLSKEAEDLKLGKISPRISLLLKKIGIDPNNVKGSEQTGGKNQSRPLRSAVPDVGPIISDLTLHLKRPNTSANSEDQKTVYISLKDPTGATFANTGYVGGFILAKDKNGEPIIKSGTHPTDDFLLALGVNKALAAKGFTNILRDEPAAVATAQKRFSRKEPIEDMDAAGSQDYEKAATYLASGYGYGYWYARDMGGGNWHIEKIADEDSARKLVGEIKRIDISYPGVTKQLSCSILTTKGRYIVEVRNTQRGIVPNQVNIRVG